MYDELEKVVLPGGGHQVQFLSTPPFLATDKFIVDLTRSRGIQP
jgi:hypothetical protein